MEQNEGIYEQIVEINNANQDSEFISQSLVEEIVVQNDNIQSTTMNCEIADMEIIIPNDCSNVQDQCTNSLISSNTDIMEHEKSENIILQDDLIKDDSTSEINNVAENINYNLNPKEEKVEEFILNNEPSFHSESFDLNSSIITEKNLETSNKDTVSETVSVKNEPISFSNMKESVSISTNSLNNSQSTTENSSPIDDKDIKKSTETLENDFQNEKETESVISVNDTENIVTLKVENSSKVDKLINENKLSTVEEPRIELNNQCTNKDQDKEEKVEYSVLISDTMSDSKILSNSDDVAVLTEFSSMEYNTQEENPPEDEILEGNHIKSDDEQCEFTNISAIVNEKIATTKDKHEDSVEKISNKEATEENKQETKSKDITEYNELENDDDDDELDLHLSSQSTESHRKVIQDIFDDWQDENGEEENNSTTIFKEQDSVEMELQNLLNDDVQQEQIVSSTNTTDNVIFSNDNVKNTEKSTESTPSKIKILSSEKVSLHTKSTLETISQSSKSPKSISNSSPVKDQSTIRSPKITSMQDQSVQKLQSPRPGVKIPGLHLTSQIASTAEVNEVLKERLREKQKEFQAPKTADLVFVKKITQRLSSQLSAVSAIPPLIPLPSTLETDNETEKDKSAEETTAVSKTTTSAVDNKELLAILEGDVDPDWSNLKPQSTTEDSNKVSSTGDVHSTSSKLDPAIERELALKQLLELPSISKKSSPGSQKKTKKSSKSESNKTLVDQSESRSADDDDESKSESQSADSAAEDTPKKIRNVKVVKKNNNQNTRTNSTASPIELSVEESRSGRKRKLTEKAREHELTVKRQKVFKGKSGMENKKSSQELEVTDKEKSDSNNSSSLTTNEIPSSSDQNLPNTPKANPIKETKISQVETKTDKVEVKQTKSETRMSSVKAETMQQKTEKTTDNKSGNIKGKISSLKRSKIGLLKKDAPISKRKIVVKNLLRQKVGKKSTTAVKTKVQTANATPKTVSTSKTSTPEKTTSTPVTTKTKKSVSEIDRLLQDEGVVNLLYDVEQPDLRKRLVPITKSQKKVMDVDKAERELKLRTKLVRNAVLRLRNSSSSTNKVSPRSRRSTAGILSAEQSSLSSNEKKASESTKSLKSPSSISVPTDFIIPAKIRNAADASRIIRRHSSSSFSSASASPRVSIDLTPETVKTDDFETQTKTKRKISQDTNDKIESKRGKKKVMSKAEGESKDSNEKAIKKEPTKKISTRSNVVSAPSGSVTKTIPRNKKVPKSRTSLDSSSGDVKSPSKSQDEELSACLAEAASALISSSGSLRSTNSVTNRKKGSTNASKLQMSDDEKSDKKKLFTNKEINVRQHGHLVQLILTPSPLVSGIRNGITIQVMNELREALSILQNDDDCRVVLFTSTGTSFCEGLELSTLIHSNKEERQIRAKEMANAVQDFIRTLATFNKPIVAGVQGAAIGLGVTMLPLFDLVIASDKATFSTPYGKLGQIAEGAAVLTLSHSLGSAVTNELLLGGRVLTASEALRAGLVTRVLWPDRFQGELLPSLKAMSEQSSQSMEATKVLLRQSFRKKLDEALESENLLLVQHWCSMECQEAIQAYIDEKGQ